MADSPKHPDNAHDDHAGHDHAGGHERIDVLGSLARDRDVALGKAPEGGMPEGATQSVRPARVEDADAIGAAQASTLAVTLAAGLETEPAALPQEIRAMLDPQMFAQSWRASIASPPSPRHHTLVAIDEGRVVGFAAIVPADQEVELAPSGPAADGDDATESTATTQPSEPTEPTEPAEPAEPAEPTVPPVVAEVVALEVPAEMGRRGHGSRLMAACVDLAKQEGATHVQTWAVQGEESRARFLDACGFAPAGLRRASQVGEKRMVELAWYAQV